MLDACPDELLLSTMMPLAPPFSLGEFGPGTPLTSDMTHPLAPGEQFWLTLQKRKSVPPPMLALKNSVTGPQRAAVLVDTATPVAAVRLPLVSKGKRYR